MAFSSGSSDPYKVLGIPRTATADEIKAAYYRMASQYHPDRPSGGDKEKMKEVVLAYEQLQGHSASHSDADFEFFKRAYHEMRRRDSASPFGTKPGTEAQYQRQYNKFDDPQYDSRDLWALHFGREQQKKAPKFTHRTAQYQAKVQEALRQRSERKQPHFTWRTAQYQAKVERKLKERTDAAEPKP